jgi:hypothetical protein
MNVSQFANITAFVEKREAIFPDNGEVFYPQITPIYGIFLPQKTRKTRKDR